MYRQASMLHQNISALRWTTQDARKVRKQKLRYIVIRKNLHTAEYKEASMPPQKLARQVGGQLSQRIEQKILYSDNNQARLQIITSDQKKKNQ